MKRLWIAFALLVLVATVCVGSLWWQMKALTHLEQTLTKAVHLVETKQPNAKKEIEYFKTECFSVVDTLAFLSRHVDGYPLKESATMLPVLLDAEDQNHFFAEAARCAFYINELRRAEKVLPGNIF